MSSFSADLYNSIAFTLQSASRVAGRRDVADAFTYGGKAYDTTSSITNSSGDNYNSDILWSAGDGGLDAFDLFWIESDVDVLLELQNDNSDAVVIPLKGGIPFIYAGGDDLLDGGLGADGSATSLPNVINRIAVKNNADGSSADVTANIRLILLD